MHEEEAAARERIAPARALPDPMVSLTYQNVDGRPTLGAMETNALSLMVTQTFPWAGKRDLDAGLAATRASLPAVGARRMQRKLEGDARRTLAELLVARAKIESLAAQQLLDETIEGAARIAYETGTGSQADLIRAGTLRMRVEAMVLEEREMERSALAMLNSLRGKGADTPFDTPSPLEALGTGPGGIPALELLLAEVERESPELAAAKIEAEGARLGAERARLELRPDISLSGGYMNRGDERPMFLVGIGASLPIFAGSRQRPMIAEAEAMARSASARVEELRRELAGSVARMRIGLASARERAELLGGAILVRDRLASESALADYRAGRGTMAMALEAQGRLLEDSRAAIEQQGRARWWAASLAEASLAPPEPPWK
jgi:outer membrane protein TolC